MIEKNNIKDLPNLVKNKSSFFLYFLVLTLLIIVLFLLTAITLASPLILIGYLFFELKNIYTITKKYKLDKLEINGKLQRKI